LVFDSNTKDKMATEFTKGLVSTQLTDRERDVLQLIIQNFILTANPVGSRFLSKHSGMGLSAATIRNVMSDLEHLGYIDHPHTSAGRVPTDKGYRVYVDTMMLAETLSAAERQHISQNIESVAQSQGQADDLLRETSRILGKISNQIAVVLSPKLSKGVFEKLEIIPLSSNRIMVVISIRSGLVKTIVMEVSAEVSRVKLEVLTAFLNERLSGLTLEEIRTTFSQRVDGGLDDTGLIRVFIDAAEKLFDDAATGDRVHFAGAENAFNQPEFEPREKLKGIIELVQNENVIVHIFENQNDEPTASLNSVRVRIGRENRDSKISECSIITAQYAVGDTMGTVGVIGPTRMNYSKIVSLVDYIAQRISTTLTPPNDLK
jgi:heat-inducible transcriptional repressor